MANADQELIKQLGKYNYVEVDGEKYGYDQLDALSEKTGANVRAALAPSDTQIYRKPTGGYTNKLDEAVGVTLDKDTGKITVTAPQSYLDDESFKSTFNEGYLKQLSSAYKRNTAYKVPNPLNDEGEDITIPELVDKFNESIQTYAKAKQAQEKLRNDIRSSDNNRNGIADRLTESDMIIMGASPWQAQSQDSALLAIPKNLAYLFKNIPGYNAEAGTISRKDFLDNFWNLDKTSDSDIQNVRQMVKDYFQYDDFTDTEEYARMTAFGGFISNKTPDTGFWNGARVAIGAAAEGAFFGIGKIPAAALSTAEGLANDINYLFTPSAWGKPIEEMKSGDAEKNAFGDFARGVVTAFNPTAMGIANFSDVAGDVNQLISGERYMSAAKQTYKDIQELEKRQSEGLAELTTSAQAVFEIADFGSNLIGNVLIGNIAGGAASTIGSELAMGSKAALAAKGVGTAKTAVKSALMVKRTAALAGTMADLSAQALVDASLQDPMLFREILDGNFTDENGKYLLSQAAWNVGGWGAAMGVKKVAKEFARTSAGKAMNAASAKTIAKMSVGVSDLNNRAHALFLGNDWVENIKNPKKKAAREFNWGINEARRGVANAKGVDDITEAVNHLKKVQNATDALQRAGSNAVQEYTNKFLNATLSGKEDEIGDIATKILNAEKRAGIATKARSFAKAADTIRVFSKDTANYIAANKQIKVLENIKEVTGSLTKHQENGLEALKKMVADSKAVIGDDVAELADKYIVSEQGWWQEFNRIRMEQGLLNKEEIEELKNSGIWGSDGELYARTQRVQEDPTYLHMRADNTTARKNVTLVDNYNWGSDKDFADPMVTRYEAMVQAGVERNSKQYFDALKEIPGIKADTKISATQTERVRQWKKFESTFSKTVEKSMKTPIAEAFSKNGIMADAIDLKAWNLEILNAEKRVRATEASAKRAETIKIEVKRADRSYAVSSMPDDYVQDIVEEAGVSGTKMSTSTGREFQNQLSELPDGTKKMLSEKAAKAGLPDGINNKRDWNRVASYSQRVGEGDLATSVNRSILENSRTIKQSERVTRYAEEMKRAQIIADREGLYRNARNYFQTLTGDNAKYIADDLTDRIIKSIDSGLDSYIATVESHADSMKVLDAVVEQSGAMNKDAVKEYLLLNEVRKNAVEARKAYGKELSSQLTTLSKGEEWLEGHKKKLVAEVEEMFDDRLNQRFNVARQVMLDEGGEVADLVDKNYMYSQLAELDREITGYKSATNVIAYQNADGAIEYVETSPLVANLYNFKPNQTDMSGIMKALNTSARLFRLGTTGMNITSMVNQQIRDFGNAWLAGGMWSSFKGASNRLEKELGPSLVDAIKHSDPEAYQNLIKVAEETGEDLSTVAVKQVQERAKVLAPGATETAAYRRVVDGNRQRFSVKNKGSLAVVDNAIDAATDRLGKINEIREQYLRKAVYMNAFYEGLQRGETYEDALMTAQFMMNNATTNFSRLMVHGQKFQQAVPYLGAAVNGTKSFWRIFSVDPVGVASRLIGGAIIPVWAVTANNMGDPANREKYMQFKEYEKDESLIVGVNGQFVRIPIPQEIAPILAPFRQLVEGLYGSDKHSFWELAANDVLGISPIDLDGFYSLDTNDLTGDPTFWDRMGEGLTGVISQVLPPPLKSAVMAMTGKDPYTGKKIDTRYSYYDEESGQVEIMDSSQSSFAKAVAGLFDGSAQMAEKVVSNIVGQTGMDVLDVFTSATQFILSSGEEGSLTTLPERAISEFSKPLTVQDYDRTQSAWNQAIRELYDEKNKIINDEKGEYQKISQQINMAKTAEERTKLINQRTSLLQPWQRKVGELVSRFQSRYGDAAFDRFRLASVLSLLNPYENQAALNAVDRSSQQEQYYSGRNEAIQTLIDMGCNGAGDMSMLGYLTKDSEGNTVTKYNSPLEILAAQNAWYKAEDIHKSNIEMLVDDAGLKTQKKAVKAQRDAIYAKDKLSKNDYAQIQAIELNWNAQVMKTIAPYIERMTPEAAINNDDVIEYLKDYIYVPSEFKKDKRGYYVTNKSLGQGSATDAYIKNYIKSIWQVNDSGYSTGRNYSKRKSLGAK